MRKETVQFRLLGMQAELPGRAKAESTKSINVPFAFGWFADDITEIGAKRKRQIAKLAKKD
jgi:hypothetical protein